MSDVRLGVKLGRLQSRHARLRVLVREFLAEIKNVPFRAADCDNKTVRKLERQLRNEVGDKK